MGELTLPRLDALDNYWRRHPPVHLLVAAYLGYKPPRDVQEVGDLGELYTMMTGRLPPGQEPPDAV